MKTLRFMVVLIGLAGCTIPTAAVVTRIVHPASGPAQMIGCQVFLNWTEEELRANCGAPDAIVAWAGRLGSDCFLYRTSAKSFATGVGVDVIAVCFGKFGEQKEVGAHLLRRHVEGIFGLAADALDGLPPPPAAGVGR